MDENTLALSDLVPKGNGEMAIYRGWMLTTEQYRRLYGEMWRRGYHLINSPDEYRYCHELPQWYPDFENTTPKTVWFDKWEIRGEDEDRPTLWTDDGERLTGYVRERLGNGPYIVKGFVKSRKHEWKDACFIESPDDLNRVAYNFLSRQGPDVDGLVFRKFVSLKRVGEHPKSGIPLFNEIRSWTVRGGPLTSHTYWGPDEGGDNIVMPHGLINISDLEGDGSAVRPLMSWRVKSNFFTMDLAQLPDTLGGGWIIIELGDGQVAGLPEHVDAEDFYRRLRTRFV